MTFRRTVRISHVIMYILQFKVTILLQISLSAAGLAQLIKRLTAERQVAGSIPGAGPLLRVKK